MSTASHLSATAKANTPAHVAIIMDGNGRWAKQRHLPRVEGHRNGVESVRAIVRACGEVGIKFLTLYAFSVENWDRPKDEVDTLMKYLARFLKNEIGELQRNNVKLETIGQIYRLPEFVQEQLKKTKAALAKNNGLTLVLALSYGGRQEIVEAVRAIADKAFWAISVPSIRTGGFRHTSQLPQFSGNSSPKYAKMVFLRQSWVSA